MRLFIDSHALGVGVIGTITDVSDRRMYEEAQLAIAQEREASARKRAEEADAEILAAIASRRKLASDLELAKGVQYTEALKTS